MIVEVAENTGSCFGVDRSIQKVKAACKKYKNVAVLGQLIHNKYAIDDLNKKFNIQTILDLNRTDLNEFDCLIIRSHGIGLDVRSKLLNYDLEIVDATCPKVKNVQKIASLLASKYNNVLILGKAGHPEVEAVVSYIIHSGANYYIANNIDQLKDIIQNKLLNLDFGVICQTTQSMEFLKMSKKILDDSNLNYELVNTICNATNIRQTCAQEYSKKCDYAIVLGGLNSSNTKNLYKICKKNCKNTIHIEHQSQLSKDMIEEIKKFNKIFIFGGASTPKYQIDSLKDYLLNL